MENSELFESFRKWLLSIHIECVKITDTEISIIIKPTPKEFQSLKGVHISLNRITIQSHSQSPGWLSVRKANPAFGIAPRRIGAGFS